VQHTEQPRQIVVGIEPNTTPATRFLTGREFTTSYGTMLGHRHRLHRSRKRATNYVSTR